MSLSSKQHPKELQQAERSDHACCILFLHGHCAWFHCLLLCWRVLCQLSHKTISQNELLAIRLRGMNRLIRFFRSRDIDARSPLLKQGPLGGYKALPRPVALASPEIRSANTPPLELTLEFTTRTYDLTSKTACSFAGITGFIQGTFNERDGCLGWGV